MPLFDLRYQLFLPFLAGIVSSTSRHQLLTRYFSCYSPRRRQPAHPTQCVQPTALLLCNCMICDAIWQADSLSWRWRAGGVFFFFLFAISDCSGKSLPCLDLDDKTKSQLHYQRILSDVRPKREFSAFPHKASQASPAPY